MQARAYAKINLCLDITGKRSDGYHNLNTIMQTIDLYDELTIKVCESEEINIKVNSNLKDLPSDERNLAYKAADMFLKSLNLKKKVEIYINKNIPVAAGLGGGSSDAACVLNALNLLTGNKIDTKSLSESSKVIGADVPFAVYGHSAIVTGIGETVQPLNAKTETWLCLVCPNLPVSTKEVFHKYTFDGKQTPNKVDNIALALEQGNLELLGNNMFNRLESVTVKDYPVIGEIKNKLIETGALGAVMSGSGPSVFGVYNELKIANEAYLKVKKKFGESCLVSCVKTI